MNRLELRTRFRNEVKDTVAPYLWDDSDINAWLNEAQDEACRRALLLVDSTSSLTSVSFAANAKGVAIDPSIIFVRRAVLASSNLPLTPRVSRSMDEEIPGWEGSSSSTVRVFIPDWQTDYLRFWPPSLAADTVRMTVVRTGAAMESDGDEPEIRATYQSFLLDWVKFRAFSVPDTDTFDPKKAEKHEAAFIKQFGEATAIGEHWALEQYYDIGAN